MRRGGKVLAMVLLGFSLLCSLGPQTSAAPAGLTVTPGALTLTLAADTKEQSAEFSVTNAYQTTVRLGFGFEPRADIVLASSGAQNALSISRTELSLKPGESTTQKVTLRDQNLSPGSHLVDLVITQHDGPANSVGIEPSIRIPLTILKQNGAVSELKLTHFSVPGLSLNLPKTLTATMRNSGNVIAIPRGVITINKLGGASISQGVVNTGSTAISPAGKLTITTPLTSLRAHPLLPGVYTATVQYGLGGDSPTTSVSRTFVYVAWWHLMILAALLIGGFYLLRRRNNRRLALAKPTGQGKAIR